MTFINFESFNLSIDGDDLQKVYLKIYEQVAKTNFLSNNQLIEDARTIFSSNKREQSFSRDLEIWQLAFLLTFGLQDTCLSVQYFYQSLRQDFRKIKVPWQDNRIKLCCGDCESLFSVVGVCQVLDEIGEQFGSKGSFDFSEIQVLVIDRKESWKRLCHCIVGEVNMHFKHVQLKLEFAEYFNTSAYLESRIADSDLVIIAEHNQISANYLYFYVKPTWEKMKENAILFCFQSYCKNYFENLYDMCLKTISCYPSCMDLKNIHNCHNLPIKCNTEFQSTAYVTWIRNSRRIVNSLKNVHTISDAMGRSTFPIGQATKIGLENKSTRGILDVNQAGEQTILPNEKKKESAIENVTARMKGRGNKSFEKVVKNEPSLEATASKGNNNTETKKKQKANSNISVKLSNKNCSCSETKVTSKNSLKNKNTSGILDVNQAGEQTISPNEKKKEKLPSEIGKVTNAVSGGVKGRGNKSFEKGVKNEPSLEATASKGNNNTETKKKQKANSDISVELSNRNGSSSVTELTSKKEKKRIFYDNSGKNNPVTCVKLSKRRRKAKSNKKNDTLTPDLKSKSNEENYFDGVKKQNTREMKTNKRVTKKAKKRRLLEYKLLVFKHLQPNVEAVKISKSKIKIFIESKIVLRLVSKSQRRKNEFCSVENESNIEIAEMRKDDGTLLNKINNFERANKPNIQQLKVNKFPKKLESRLVDNKNKFKKHRLMEDELLTLKQFDDDVDDDDDEINNLASILHRFLNVH